MRLRHRSVVLQRTIRHMGRNMCRQSQRQLQPHMCTIKSCLKCFVCRSGVPALADVREQKHRVRDSQMHTFCKSRSAGVSFPWLFRRSCFLISILTCGKQDTKSKNNSLDSRTAQNIKISSIGLQCCFSFGRDFRVFPFHFRVSVYVQQLFFLTSHIYDQLPNTNGFCRLRSLTKK